MSLHEPLDSLARNFIAPLPVDSMAARDLNTVGPCRLFAGLFFFFKFPETRNSSLPSSHFYDTWRYNFDTGDFFLPFFFFFYFTNTILVIASLKYSILSEILKRKEKKNNAGVFSL